MEKPHPVWETQEVRKSSREAFGWGMVWKDAQALWQGPGGGDERLDWIREDGADAEMKTAD